MALNPPTIRYIKGYQYRVREGDHVGSITNKFGMPTRRWPELVGANRDKPLSSCSCLNHLCFKSLSPGEMLRIPAHWREPRVGMVGVPNGYLGAVEIPSHFLVEAFTDALKAVWVKVFPSVPIPPNMNKIGEIIFSWWPHLKDSLPNSPPIPSMPTPEAIVTTIANGILTEENFANLFRSANEFLTSLGYGSNNTQPLPPSIPQIPWGDVPWNRIGEELGKISTNLSDIFAQKQPPEPGTPEPGTPTPPLPPVLNDLPNFFDPAYWGLGTTTGTTMQKVASSPMMRQGTWSDFLVLVVQDPRFTQCAMADTNGDRFKKLEECQECFNTPSQFVDLLCGTGDPCDCKPLPEPSTPPKTEPSTPPVQPTSESKAIKYAAWGVGIALVGGLLVVISGDRK